MAESIVHRIKEIKVLLITGDNANRTALESMLSFGSQDIKVKSQNYLPDSDHEFAHKGHDIVIICDSILADLEATSFLKKIKQVPVLIIDDYYNKLRCEKLMAAGALDYLDLSTLDSRLLIKSINFSIQQHNAEIAARIARKAMRIRSSFQANISHEIRTPLNSIIGFSELLYDEETDPVKKEKLNMMRQSGKHLLTLINSILDFSKLEAGKIKLEKKEFSLDNLIQTLYYMLLVKCGDKSIDLNIKPVGNIPETVIGDEFRLNQVLINLTNNAIKFTESGSVTLEYQFESNKAVISVIDTGIGIPADKINHVFNAFEQVYASEYLSHEGTGLGLAISKSLVNLMQGSISVESEPGSGSVFTISIPLQVKKWQTNKTGQKGVFQFPGRILGAIFESEEQRSALQKWLKVSNINAYWHKIGYEPDNRFFTSDLFLIPQEFYLQQKEKFLSDLINDSRSSFKPKILFSFRSNRFFFTIPSDFYSTQLLEFPDRLIDKNLKTGDFISSLNGICSEMENLGKKLIKKWKTSFEQENPGLEEVFNEALLRFYDRSSDLNLAWIQKEYSQIQEVAHSLKGFTGQTCMFEVSNRANILLNEMRRRNHVPSPSVIQREISAINEILWLLPRSRIGIKTASGSVTGKGNKFFDMQVLVAEDNAINQAVIKDFLEHFGLLCTLVNNGKEALDELEKGKFNLLFLDLQMPVMNGIETLKSIRAVDKFKEIYVVVITAYVTDHPDLEYITDSSNAILTKPFEKKKLYQILKNAEDYISNMNSSRI